MSAVRYSAPKDRARSRRPPTRRRREPRADGRRLVVLDIDDTLYLERDCGRSGVTAPWAPGPARSWGSTAWASGPGPCSRRGFGARSSTMPSPAPASRTSARPRAPGSGRGLPVARTDHRDAGRRRSVARPPAPARGAAVVTAGPLTSQHAKAEALQLSRWADLIVFTETLGPGRGKPHPAAFEQLEREVGLRGDRCAYVADNPAKDFVAPIGWGGGRCACAAWAACGPMPGAAATSTRRSRA